MSDFDSSPWEPIPTEDVYGDEQPPTDLPRISECCGLFTREFKCKVYCPCGNIVSNCNGD